MKPLLANDLVVQEDNCNLSCKYCLTGQSMYKQGHLDKMIFSRRANPIAARARRCAPVLSRW